MRRPRLLRIGLLALLTLLSTSLPIQSLPPIPPTPPVPPAPFQPGLLPVAFEPNAGQTDPQVRYLAHTPGGTFLFAPDQMILTLAAGGCAGSPADCAAAVDHTPRCADRGGHTAAPPPPGLVRMRFLDALPTVALTATTPLPGRASYFTGNDPARWQGNLPTYGGLLYAGLYPGIDLRYDGKGARLKGTYTIAAGADPGRIRWHYEGATGLQIDAQGNLHYGVGTGEAVTEQVPTAWQEHAGARVGVRVRYHLDDEGNVGFTLGPYDPGQALIIDPTLLYATTLGGSEDDDGWAITLDGAGNTYVTGQTTSPDFPVWNAYQPHYSGGYSDVFVLKLNPAGTVLAATYLGGSGEDMGLGISVDTGGNVYLAGSTNSTDFPLANAVQPSYGGGNVDAFVTELNAAGTALVTSTYLGGNYDDCTVGIAADAAGNVYTAGYTASTNFPAVHAIQATNGGSWDAFAVELADHGRVIRYSTYLGGSEYELLSGFALDPAGNAYLTGETASQNFPTHNAAQPANAGEDDVFVSKLSADGQTLIYSTYLGGSDEDGNWGIAVDDKGNAYISGDTHSPDFPTRNAAQPHYGGNGDAFVTKLNPEGTALVFSTYLGGSDEDSGRGIAVDRAGVVYLGGTTHSADFPLVDPFQSQYAGEGDAFAVQIEASGKRLLYATFIGGTGEDESRGLSLDSAGDVYLTGYTTSPTFPLNNPHQPANPAGHNVFVVGVSPRLPDDPGRSTGK